MVRHTLDPGVFIRSMAARGHLGGLAAAAREAIRLIDASGRDRCLLETVGVGQSELEVMETADTTVVVTTPTTGDAVQILKAGILEIADIFVVNKADLPGASRVVRDPQGARPPRHHATGWSPPVLTRWRRRARASTISLLRSTATATASRPQGSWSAAGSHGFERRSRRSWSSERGARANCAA